MSYNSKKTMDRILILLKEKGKMEKKQIVNELGLADVTVALGLNALRHLGYLEFEEPTRGFWKLSDKLKVK